MARAGMTEKPCPGCGKPGFRAKDCVCSDCAADLKFAKDVRASRAATPGLEARQFFRLEYYDCQGMTTVNRDSAPRERFTAAMQALIHYMFLSDPEKVAKVYNAPRCPANMPQHERIYDSRLGTAMVPAAAAAVIDELDAAVREFLLANYNDGKELGQDLLVQLSRGDITVDKFNEVSGYRAGKRR